jgi:hypothetical protein
VDVNAAQVILLRGTTFAYPCVATTPLRASAPILEHFNLTIPAGGNLTFRYRFYLHEEDEKKAGVAERYQDYLAGKPLR